MNIHNKPQIRCACVVGTRPEVIKMAPVIRRLRQTDWADPFVITTGQQDGLLEQALNDFHLVPDHAIAYDPKGTNVVPVLASIAGKLDETFDRIRPAVVIAQGDTTTVFAASLAAFYRRIPFVHVEAGLRTSDLSAPFPEEFHRRAIAVSTLLHCAPTKAAASHLRNENVPASRILVSGNTVIDALLETAACAPAPPRGFPKVPRPVLLTAHRRENFGEPLREALTAIRAFVEATPDTAVFFPVHPNPAARSIAQQILSNHERIVLAEPASYAEIVGAMQRSWLVVTDSGGLQEEAPALGKPVLVLRDVTERPEAVAAGAVRVVGTARRRIFQALTDLHCNTAAYERMAKPIFPYGDGHAAQRIVAALRALMAVPAGVEARATARKQSRATWSTSLSPS
jgi:UDP-N-acetylglucosamine 2-epimerase (non-hydrolysing)